MHIHPIVIIAIIVIGLVLVGWIIAMLMDGRKLRGMRPIGYPTTARDREEYARTQRLRDEVGPIFNEEGHSNEEDETTKTWPGPPATV